MSRLRILLLEDNPLDAELILAALADGGFACEARRVDTREAFRDELARDDFDVVLADYSLPRFDGAEALELARATCPECPFLFVSGRLGEELAIETLKRGATDYVLKHRLERLVPSVRRALGEAEERAERRRAERELAAVRDELAVQLADMTRLHEWSARLATSLELQPVLEEVLGAVTAIEGSDQGVLMLFDREAEELYTAASRGLSEDYLNQVGRIPVGQGPCGAAVAQRGRCIVVDVEADPVFASRLPAARLGGYRAVHATPLLTRGGDVVGAIAVYFRQPHAPSDRETRLVDLYAHHAAEAIDNARLYREVQEAGRRKDEFLAMLGHELRNPLAPVRNALQILRLRGDEPATREWARQMMDRQVTHMTRLVDDLLDVSRITRGKVLLRQERADLVPLVRAAVEDHRAALESAGLKVEYASPPEPVWVTGDPTRLAQVVDNLLTNAAKFTDGGGRVGVRLTADAKAGRATVAVRDTGIGIEPDLLPHLFETFMQADRSLDRSRGGLGLGLALVKGLIELHGGRVRAESAGPGQGATFTFWLPLASAAPPDLESGSGEHPLGLGRRVLVVEDSRDTALSLKMLLEMAGHQVALAHTGREGVEAARRERPEVVLCDLGLPEMDGFAVARHLRRDPATAEAWLIAVSGFAQEEDQQRALEAGFDRHLTKPVDPGKMLKLLAGLPARR